MGRPLKFGGVIKPQTTFGKTMPLTWPQPEDIRLGVMDPWITGSEIKAVQDVVISGWIGSASPLVAEFEAALADYLGQQTLAVSNGSVALLLALAALDIGPGHEVILPAFAYAATASSVVRSGACPVFCDVNRDSWQLEFDNLASLVTEKTRAVILPHSYGVAGNLDAIARFCRNNNLYLVEDAAEAFSGAFDRKRLGTFGDIGVFSFFPNKLITTGEGGAVTAQDPSLVARMRLLRGQGMSDQKRYWFLEPGFNFRMTGMQAALGLAQLRRLDEISEVRVEIERRYEKLLNKYLKIPEVSKLGFRAPWIFSGILREGFSGSAIHNLSLNLANQGIETRPLFYSLPSMPAFSRYSRGSFPVAEALASRGISLPSSHHVTPELQDAILSEFEKVFENGV